MISKKDIESWLELLPDDDQCFIDEGGLTLCSSYRADAFIEIGGDNDWIEEWRSLYKKAVDGPNTVICDECGYILYGDKPEIAVECLDCFMKRKVNEDKQKAEPSNDGGSNDNEQ